MHVHGFFFNGLAGQMEFRIFIQLICYGRLQSPKCIIYNSFFQYRWIMILRKYISAVGNVFKKFKHWSIVSSCWDIYRCMHLLFSLMHTLFEGNLNMYQVSILYINVLFPWLAERGPSGHVPCATLCVIHVDFFLVTWETIVNIGFVLIIVKGSVSVINN